MSPIPRSDTSCTTIPERPTDRRLSRRAFGRSVAAATAATTLGSVLWPELIDASPLIASSSASSATAAAGGLGLIRIGSNENPYGLGPAAMDAVLASRDEANRYPMASITSLMTRLGELHGVGQDSILMSPGSGDILRAASLAFLSPTKALVQGGPTFEAPGRTAKMVGAPVVDVPVQASGSLDLDAMAAKAAGAGLFFVCNPNNPTGGVNSGASVTEFIARVRKVSPDAVILVDEAYFEFADDPAYTTMVPLTKTDPKVIVSRTFSKIHGMAGLRVGYAIGHPATLSALRRTMGSGTLSGLSASAALASLNDTDHMKKQIALNGATRKYTRDAFERAGFAVLPSQANFVMVDVKRPVTAFQSQCRAGGVQIARPFPPLDTHARITVGTMEEMQRALAIMLPLLQTTSSAALHAANEQPVGSRAPFAPFDPVEWDHAC
jgi:histidinol-phosphate aminotransferase